jgi:hypothetical protein
VSVWGCFLVGRVASFILFRLHAWTATVTSFVRWSLSINLPLARASVTIECIL